MKSRLGRDEPVGVVAAQAAALVELEQPGVGHAENGDRLGLDDGHLRSESANPFQSTERFAHVVEHPQEEHHVETAELSRVDGHEVDEHRLDGAADDASGQIESRAAGSGLRVPELGEVKAVVGDSAVGFAKLPVPEPGGEVDRPGVVVHRDDA